MAEYSDLYEEIPEEERPPDPKEEEARDFLRQFFEENQNQVFFSRQIEVQNEQRYFHWITNRAIRDLEQGIGLLRSEIRKLPRAGTIKLLWHRNFRYYKREAKRIASIVDEYANPNIGGALGLHGELMVLEAFARAEFVMRGRETRAFRSARWSTTDHDLDFVFERDGIAYGIEVKNTLGYMNYDELLLKIDLCKYLGLRPVFVVRMMPKSWMFELIEAGGFGLIMKYQLYPWTHKDLGRRVAKELGLPIDAPRAIQEGTMARFLKWHKGLLPV